MEFTLLGSVAVAALFMYGVVRFESGRTNAADCTKDVWDALISAAVVGVAVGRLAAMMQAGTNPISHPGDILIVRAGVDTVTASVAALTTYVVLTRSDPWWLADSAAPAALAGITGWHGGCVVRDACLGTPSDLPWAVTQSGSAISRHPVEIYAALLLGLAVVLLILWKRHRPGAGVIAAVAIGVASATRWITEPLRPGLGNDLSWWYASATIAAIFLIVWRTHLARSSDTESVEAD